MWRWAALHPYNVCDALEWPGEPSVDDLSAALAATLVRRSFEGPPAPPARYRGSLEAALTSELNAGFPTGAVPARVFVVHDDQGRHHAGSSWAHWLADGRAGAELVREVMSSVLGLAGERSLAPGAPVRGARMRDAPRVIARLLSLRQAHSPSCGPRHELGSAVALVAEGRPLHDGLRVAARARGVTVNDLLLAALVEAVARVTPERARQERSRISVATMVDLRRFEPGPPAAGVRLGYFLTEHAGFSTPFESLVPEVHAAAARGKTLDGVSPSLLEIAVAERHWGLLAPPRRATAHANSLVLSAGLTNLVLPADELGGRVAAWRRAVPTGPMTPLALCALSAGGRLSVSLTHRLTGYPPDAVAEIRESLRHRLEGLAGA